MKEQTNKNLLEAYFEGKLSQDEKKQFEQELEKDGRLLAQFKQYQSGMTFQSLARRQHLLKEWEEVTKASDKKYRKQYSSRFWKFSIAASLFLIACTIAFFCAKHKNSNGALVAKHFQAYSGMGTLMDSPSIKNQTSIFTMAFGYYNNEEWTLAIDAFNKIQTNHPQYTLAQFYLGNALMVSQNQEKALVAFNISKQKSDLKDPSLWYAALAHIAINQIDKALPILESLANHSNDIYQEKAQKLLEELK